MNITIKTIESRYMPYTTVGHWTYTREQFTGLNITILIAKMSDWRFEASVLIHELIEVFWCIWYKVTTDQCDKWDNYYEQLYSLGFTSKKVAAGSDKKCPYYWGHTLGNIFSWVFEKIVRVDISKYRKEADLLMNIKGD